MASSSTLLKGFVIFSSSRSVFRIVISIIRVITLIVNTGGERDRIKAGQRRPHAGDA
jgi:hypothetical protein